MISYQELPGNSQELVQVTGGQLGAHPSAALHTNIVETQEEQAGHLQDGEDQCEDDGAEIQQTVIILASSFLCSHCDKTFSTLKDLMSHKKKMHVQNVSTCLHFSKGSCTFGDENCWFMHKDQSKESGETEKNSMKCNICDKILKTKKEYMVYRKKEHEENIQTCNLYKKGTCTYKESCWFSHNI